MKKNLLWLMFLIIFITGCDKDIVNGIDNYDKKNLVHTYGWDLDTNLSIFPDDKENIITGSFKSFIEFGPFDNSGYIILDAYYNEENYKSELERLSMINITVSETCRPNTDKYTNYIMYDENSYEYPAYVSIDGFTSKYEYALLNEKELKITYVYIAYPDLKNEDYYKHLKKDKDGYSEGNTLELFSIYSHSFDNGYSYSEASDCN